MRVLWSGRALRDALRIRNYLLDRNPLAAVALAESLIAAGNNLSRFPRRYPERGEGYREMVVSRYHDIVRYELMPVPPVRTGWRSASSRCGTRPRIGNKKARLSRGPLGPIDIIPIIGYMIPKLAPGCDPGTDSAFLDK